MTIDYEKAASHWTDQEPESVRMPEDELRAEISAFLDARKVGALATAGSSIVRCTPIEYFIMGDNIYMFSEGGLKFRALSACENACLAVYDPDPSFSGLNGLQVTGTAAVVEPFCQEYLDACAARELDPERLRGLPFTMHLIRLRPSRYDLLESSLKAQGYSVRQWLEV